MTIDKDISGIMFATEVDTFTAESSLTDETFNVTLIDEDYRFTFYDMFLWSDMYGEIHFYHFADILNDYLKDSPTNVTIKISTFEVSACFIPAKILPLEPAKEYIKKHPLSTVRGVKTCFLDHAEILPVCLAVGLWTLEIDVMCKGIHYTESSNVKAEGITFVMMELLVDPIAILKKNGISPEQCFVRAKVSKEDVEIVQEYEFRRPPYGGYTLLFENAFRLHECIPVVHTERKTKAERQYANINGKLSVYDIKDSTTWEIKSYPLRDGEVEMAADFIRSREIIDEKGISYVIKDGNVNVKSDAAEMYQMQAVLQQSEHLKRFDGRRPRVFDNTFDQTFE